MSAPRILVLGAGPAGAAAALGLRRLGYPVCVISEWRRFEALEGVSQRVLNGLRQAGLTRALACANLASPRRVHWNGDEQRVNQEFLLDRATFDAALREDLHAAGIELIAARVHDVETVDGATVRLESGETLCADFLVEARGRQAPLAGKRQRGPETLSLLNQWQEAPGRPASAVESLADGWAWMARLADGRCYWQITIDASAACLPGKPKLPGWCAQRRSESILVHKLFSETAVQPAALHARSSTAILADEVCGANWLRVGDAAMAVDPLSGNGIFQSLSSALQAPAVINTLLRYPAQAELARRFHRQRVRQLFLRFARIGRDFYAMERRWAAEPFWQARSGWPDAEPVHVPTGRGSVQVERSPVLNGDRIEEVDVVITDDQPLGIWHLQGVELAPLVRALQAGEGMAGVLSRIPVERRAMLHAWLAAHFRPAA
ncbi:MAG: tryptophan 7-halogenase [Pseudomonadota bacterium]|jgi:flavin-dependent dehydrogenase|uniref:flavin-dependent monooxygenase QhpG n=1 Tax=Stutzerimonas TaxID=2901164 RepID=UPI0005976635|nr:tryptophan 7-halogenase [Stutzerimonas kunmingensis]KIL02716.1 FAD-dependent oxidoreductase [Stutzerimonas stutzeri]MBD3877374.1 tryptophan 7-halogenase [Stutzerimonas kunmingensis]HAV05794.1 FAD-dependent oxidoreductase [Pseudomonas sp.]